MIYFSEYLSPLGEIHIAERDEALIGVWIKGQSFRLPEGEKDEDRETPLIIRTKSWLECYFSGEKPDVSALPLSLEGSKFRQTVWRLLREIPYGETVTYKDLAEKIERLTEIPKMAPQAIGGAVGHNPVSIIVPCHRVVGANGNLTGYAGGIPLKIQLLTHEGVDMSAFHEPKTTKKG